jgi:hypothetical protein
VAKSRTGMTASSTASASPCVEHGHGSIRLLECCGRIRVHLDGHEP